MGAKGSVTSLKKKDIKDFTDATHFEGEEVVALYEHFRTVITKGGGGAEDLMDRGMFLQSLGIKGSVFVDRMFSIIDEDRDGKINFAQYLTGLSVLSARGTYDEKIKFAFHVYDFDADGKISKAELTDFLQWSLEESEVKVTTSQVASIIEETFKVADKNRDGFIDPGEFRGLVDSDSSILGSVTLDFKGAMLEAAGGGGGQED